MRRARALLFSTETRKLELLNTPIHQLNLRFEGTIFAQAIPVVMEELRRAGITRLKPIFYISTGYGCIAGQPIISLGFYDFDPLLKDLNEEFRGWRYSDADIFDLIRHECGHAFCYAYKLYRRKDFRELFNVRGHFFNTYPEGDDYDYNPRSRQYVNPNGDHYAQKHPDEDFAETFTVWLTPRSNWRKVYRHYPKALAKLEFTGQLVAELGRQPILVEVDEAWKLEPYESIKQTVAEFMGATLDHYYERATGYVDPDLKALFRPQPVRLSRRQLYSRFMRAEAFIKAHKQQLIHRVPQWTGVDSTVAYDVLDKILTRAKALDLWLEREQEEKKLVELTSYVTALCLNYKNTGQFLLELRPVRA
ncbi:MAG: hypothetical protein RMM31_07185 [Anaerolineae bacterium]|nr:hypothetical protein [Thermoflexales bacterium]MDW8396009.1 hypothetical protein [Anaerolineae bacterium]